MGFPLQAFGCTFRRGPWPLDPAPLPLSPGPWPLDPMPLVAGPGHLSLALASGPWYRDPGLDPCPWLAPVVPCSWSCCSWPLGWAMGLSALLMGLGPWLRAWGLVSTMFSNPHIPFDLGFRCSNPEADVWPHSQVLGRHPQGEEPIPKRADLSRFQSQNYHVSSSKGGV